MSKQELLHIDATPSEDYAIRILRAYRAQGNFKWSSSTDDAYESNPLIVSMNELQEQRNAILDAAIGILENRDYLKEKIERAFYDGIQRGKFGIVENGTTGALEQAEAYRKKILP